MQIVDWEMIVFDNMASTDKKWCGMESKVALI